MKKLFSKDNFLGSSFDKKQKWQSAVVYILLSIFFVLSSFTFFNFLFSFVDVAGSIVSGSMDVAIRDFLRNLPLLFVFLMTLWSLLLVHAVYINRDEEHLRKSIIKDSICILSFALVNLIYVIVRLAMGEYVSIAEGSPSKLFPLDTLLYSLPFVLFASLCLIYVFKKKEALPYLVPTRGSITTKARFVYCLFMALWLLFALYGFSSGILSFFIYDFAHGHAFYGIATLFCYLLSPAFLIFWELYFHGLKEEKRKEALLPWSIIGLSISLLGLILYFVSLALDLDAPSNAGFGMFPIMFSASVNLAAMLQVSVPFIVSLVALIKALIWRRDCKQRD